MRIRIPKSKTGRAILLLAVFVLAVTGKSFLTYAAQFIDSFTDTSRVANTWNVTVDTGNGEVKLSERTCDDGVWFCGTGFDNVCPNSLGDGNYIIVKRQNETTAQWKTTQTDCNKPECGQDGGQNGDNLVADNTVNFGAYPARNACETAGGRLPTLSELQCIYSNRSTFGDNYGSSNYWSATENSSAYASLVYFSTGSSVINFKTTTHSVRCVRGW